MRRLLAVTGSGGTAPIDPVDPTDPPDPTEPTLPYAFPTSAPWNVPTYCITPTPDETGSVIHPSVLDFGATPWHGWRFWMAVTPMYLGIEDLENPCVLVSADGYQWQVPAGLTNPLDPDPTGPAYNSDTELLYDAPNDRLVVFWRELDPSAPVERIWRMTSTNGSTWTPKQLAISSNSIISLISPTVAPYQGGYAMWVLEDYSLMRYTAPTITSAFNPATRTPFGIANLSGFTPAVNKWHVAVTLHAGKTYGLLLDTSTSGKRLIPMTLRPDGSEFVAGPAVIQNAPSSWDSEEVYRGAIQVHQNGTHMRVWYSGRSEAHSWRVGYTRIPLSLWPAP